MLAHAVKARKVRRSRRSNSRSGGDGDTLARRAQLDGAILVL